MVMAAIVMLTGLALEETRGYRVAMKALNRLRGRRIADK